MKCLPNVLKETRITLSRKDIIDKKFSPTPIKIFLKNWKEIELGQSLVSHAKHFFNGSSRSLISVKRLSTNGNIVMQRVCIEWPCERS